MQGSADYKRHLAAELTTRTLRTSVERVRNTPKPVGP
jgi:carbon-monoxide dehydrogenase medium subunit